MSDYQPRQQGGWPTQPPAGGGQYGQSGYGQGPYVQPPQRAPRRRRRRHPLLWLLVVVVVLAVICVVGDQFARSYAQSQVADQIQSSGLNTKPSVKIEGWPFLTQIAAHDLKAVDISANNATADDGKLKFSFSAKATGVHLNSSFNGGTVDNINANATFPFSSVDGLIPVPGAMVTADPADGPDAIKVNLSIVGTVTGTVKLVSASKISIQLNSASGLASLFGGVAGQSFTIDVPQLPAGLVVRSVAVTSQGIVATASASNTTLTQ